MVASSAKTPAQYLESLPADKRAVISTVRDVILKNLPDGYKETINWGMLCYEIPLSTYSDTYNGQPLMYAALAAQKNYFAVYLTGLYVDDAVNEWFLSEWKKTGKKLDMGKSCIRFKTLNDLPLDLIGNAIAKTSVNDYIRSYELGRSKK